VLSLDVSVLQQPMLPVDRFVQKQPVLCQEVKGLQQLVLHMYVRLQEPVFNLDVSLYKSFCADLDVSAYKSFELYWTCLSTRACCCSCACLSTNTL
jgi:hypothetical protein